MSTISEEYKQGYSIGFRNKKLSRLPGFKRGRFDRAILDAHYRVGSTRGPSAIANRVWVHVCRTGICHLYITDHFKPLLRTKEYSHLAKRLVGVYQEGTRISYIFDDIEEYFMEMTYVA